MLAQDDIYRGYHMPAGAIVMGNVWCDTVVALMTSPAS